MEAITSLDTKVGGCAWEKLFGPDDGGLGWGGHFLLRPDELGTVVLLG